MMNPRMVKSSCTDIFNFLDEGLLELVLSGEELVLSGEELVLSGEEDREAVYG